MFYIIIGRIFVSTKNKHTMKNMINTIREVYQEDKREFWEGILGTVLIMMLMVFLIWFTGTFMYDM